VACTSTPDRAAPENDDVIAVVALESHPNAVKLARSEMLSALPFLMLGVR
jgi:hypothetical protein